MPIMPAAKKDLRKNQRRHKYNLKIKKPLRQSIKALRQAIAAADHKKAADLLKPLIKQIDKAAQKKVIKANNASRHKSRLQKQVNALKQTKAQ